MHINHLHLCSTDVPATAAFLCEHFGFSLLAARATRAFAALEDDSGLSLVLMPLPPGEAHPQMFHLGFLLDHEAEVIAQHARLVQSGAHLAPLERSRGALRFYCRAPGGLLIEVGQAGPGSGG